VPTALREGFFTVSATHSRGGSSHFSLPTRTTRNGSRSRHRHRTSRMFLPSYDCLRSDGGVDGVCRGGGRSLGVAPSGGRARGVARRPRPCSFLAGRRGLLGSSRGSIGSAPRSQDGGDCSDRREARSSVSPDPRDVNDVRTVVARPRSTTPRTITHALSHDTHTGIRSAISASRRSSSARSRRTSRTSAAPAAPRLTVV
jgi:hypothetical protein